MAALGMVLTTGAGVLVALSLLQLFFVLNCGKCSFFTRSSIFRADARSRTSPVSCATCCLSTWRVEAGCESQNGGKEDGKDGGFEGFKEV